ncbi:MAG: AarF/UbiB family protein [Thermoanaerobaculales bacterium]|jgi:ubiquinone biosynthesis protein|nr:AarF/UbiB family protein [Thermoanaerobaculales bacterium]
MEEFPEPQITGEGGQRRERRRRPRRRGYINVPDLARRGRTTLRHISALVFGGYVASVEASRRRGDRGLLFRARALGAFVIRPFLDRGIRDLPFPEQLRKRLEILGPTYVKLGQVLSLRKDVLPEVVTDELRNLLADLPPVEFDKILAVIEEDLDGPSVDVFESIDPEPLGSASIAQSHRARLRTGEDVILKVVKPGIRELIYRDSTLLRSTARVLQLIIPRYQPKRVIDEFCDYTVREVEMVLEADNAETFAANFVDDPDIVFPKIYRDYSGSKVLCMEFLDGVRPDDPSVVGLPPDQRQKMIDLGAEAIIRMLYQDGFFHADLHPANLLALPGPKVGFIDLGMVGHFDPELRHNLLHLFYSLVMEDFERAARYLAAVSQTGPGSDVLGFRTAVKEVARRWRKRASFEEFSLALLILECVQLGARYQLYFPVEMVLMVKALITYEGVGYLLDEDFNVAEVAHRHVGRIFRMEFSPVRLFREGVRAAPDLVDAFFKMPLLVSEGISVLEERSQKKPRKPLSGLRASVFGGFSLVAGAILLAFDGPWVVALMLMVVGMVLSLSRTR